MNSLRFYLSIFFIFSFSIGQMKNIHVLDFQSERNLKKYMKSIGKDLGVKCMFCHDINDKSIDTNHKLIAREMMKMQKNLNQQTFAMFGDSLMHRNNTLEISCWTCHRGYKKPQLVRPKK